MATVVVADSLADLLRIGDEKLKLLLGYESESGFTLLACASLTTPTDTLKHLLPGGIAIVGIAIPESEKPANYAKIKQCLSNDSKQKVFLYISKGLIESAELVTEDNTKTTAEFNITHVDLLSRFVIGRCKCDVPISFTIEKKDTWKNGVTSEIDRVVDSIMSDCTVYHLQSSQALINLSNCQQLPDNATYTHLAGLIEDEDQQRVTRSKSKHKEILMFDMYTNLNSAGYTDTIPTCSPVINYNTEAVKTVKLVLHLDVVSLFEREILVSDMVVIMSEAIKNQLMAMKQCIFDNTKGNKFILPEVYHFQPFDLPTLFNVIYPWNILDEQLENHRRSIHQCLCLPIDRPLFRRANKYRFSDERQDGSYLRNVHLNCLKSKVSEGKQYTVNGNYTYHHYMQDRFDDNKWGCAYRSLQTLVSWFKLQGYTEKNIPTHREIQQTLVDIGDKEPNFVGSRQWIGSMEVSFVLDTLLEVQSKILNVSSGGDLAGKGRELAQHFLTQGTPIMIGGGVLAHTILGIDYNEVTGDINFLILDPHYTGAEDLKTIIDKGWCGWKDGNFWDKNAHYNLCMPQRPIVI
ncbi:ufm1-specific protease 2-like isoform X2 [Ruditapes philippinarum]|uniref:ufm1-specific protease 2-like isoform X2 n=1 Tax=Ruditapes philippinarum TaxID=129788 RepID=UPI00295C151E|nr:ufm1-specific protease 2-like isoform X2 [Ruditapes philippinarum]